MNSHEEVGWTTSFIPLRQGCRCMRKDNGSDGLEPKSALSRCRGSERRDGKSRLYLHRRPGSIKPTLSASRGGQCCEHMTAACSLRAGRHAIIYHTTPRSAPVKQDVL